MNSNTGLRQTATAAVGIGLLADLGSLATSRAGGGQAGRQTEEQRCISLSGLSLPPSLSPFSQHPSLAFVRSIGELRSSQSRATLSWSQWRSEFELPAPAASRRNLPAAPPDRLLLLLLHSLFPIAPPAGGKEGGRQGEGELSLPFNSRQVAGRRQLAGCRSHRDRSKLL